MQSAGKSKAEPGGDMGREGTERVVLVVVVDP